MWPLGGKLLEVSRRHAERRPLSRVSFLVTLRALHPQMEEPQWKMVKRTMARNHGIVKIRASPIVTRPPNAAACIIPARKRALLKHKQRSLRSTKEDQKTPKTTKVPGASNEELNGIVVVVELNIPRPLPVGAYKFLIAGGPLVLGVSRQHALQAHTHALDVLDGAPALLAEEVEADDAVGVDVRVHRDGSVGGLDEGHLGGFCRVG